MTSSRYPSRVCDADSASFFFQKEEDAREQAFEKDVAEQRKKQQLHDEALQKKAAAEQAKSHLEASKTTVPNSQETATATASLQPKSSTVSRSQQLAAGPHGGVQKVDVHAKELVEERERREAFFKAMAQKAAAEFKAMPTSA